ncbi:MAG: alpha/beta hydrolase-fold protein [Lachnospiraceae bacterium]|nr:alpha/beta hydrolase-fold protein [Lachnospiraceae bacterium]
MADKKLVIGGKEIEIFGQNEKAPLVIFHAFDGEGEAVHAELQKYTAVPYNLAVVNNLAWDDEMTPWPAPGLTKKMAPFKGEGKAYLQHLQEEILPAVLKELPDEPLYLCMAGYSLGGLFALYAGYETDRFARIASASGSLWYPGFREYAEKQKMGKTVQKVYVSLGDLESRTRNQYLRTVGENTEWFAEHLRSQGIETLFAWNEGNHQTDADGRMARAIAAVLT